MKRRWHIVPLLILSLLMAGGCTARQNAASPSSSYSGQSRQLGYGTVENMQVVQLENSGEGGLLGAGAGAVLGGLAGSAFGGGSGKTWATVGGALAGAAVGYSAQKQMTHKNGLQLTIRMENGEIMTVIQDGKTLFNPGERVRVEQNSDGTYRVTR